MLFKFFILIVTFSIFLSCNSQPEKVFPKEEWQICIPEDQGINSVKLQEALDYFESSSGHNGNKEVLIVRNGCQIFGGENIDSIHNIWSCSKTFTSTVLGLLVDDGVISLDDKVSNYEPLLKNMYPEVTFRHFTTMTSGYSALGSSRWKSNNNDDWSLTVYEPEDPYFKPGSAFAYWDEAQMMFGRALTQINKRPMHEFLQERITNKIGMGNWEWHPEKELKGVPINNGCSEIFINAKQLARWGLLFLNEGNWDGKQLISKQWVKMATSVQVPASLPMGDTGRKEIVGPGCYGFNWWVNGKKANGMMKLPEAPEGCYFASGYNNNKCIVVPQWDMVVIRMGEDGHPKYADEVYGTFLKMLGEAIE